MCIATNMVAEQNGSARSKAFMARILEAVVALLSRSLGCFVMGSAWAHLRLKAFIFLFDLCSAPPSELNWLRGVAKRRHSIVYKNMFQISLHQF